MLGVNDTRRAIPDHIDIAGILADSPVHRGHLIIVALSFVVLTVDGYNLVITSQLLPAIASGLRTSSAAVANTLAVQTAGQAFGAFLLSPLADRFGRKPLLLICLVLAGLGSLAVLPDLDILQFGLTRFGGGLLAGALMPIMISLVADTAPVRWRSRFIGMTYAGLAVGPLGAAAVATWLIEPFGWRSGFWIGGLAPLAMVPLILWFVPESPLHLARRKVGAAKINAALRRIGIPAVAAGSFGVADAPVGRPTVPIIDLFRDGRTLLTVSLWLASALMAAAGVLLGLMAAFFHDFASIPLSHFAPLMALGIVGGIIASFLVGAAMDRIGRFPVLWISATAAGTSVVGLALCTVGSPLFVACMICAWFFGSAAQQALNIVCPGFYPSRMRATAIGWHMGVGRLAGALAPLAGAAVLASKAGLLPAMLLTAAPIFVMAVFTPLIALGARRSIELAPVSSAGEDR